MSKKERNFPEFNFGGYQQMEPPSENTRPIVFEDEFTTDYIENHYPRIHYHNDTNCFSKKSPRIYPKDVGKLCKNVFTEDDEEKKARESMKKNNFPEFNFGGYQQMEPPNENTCPIVFEDKFTNDYKENHYPRIHYHNDTNCFSKKSPRIYPKDVGKLCKNVFTEDDEEKKLVLKKNIKPYSK